MDNAPQNMTLNYIICQEPKMKKEVSIAIYQAQTNTYHIEPIVGLAGTHEINSVVT